MTPAEKASKTRNERALTAKICKLYPTLSPDEIGAQLGMTGSAVKHRLKKSGCKLREFGEAVRLAKTGQPRGDSVAKWPIVAGMHAAKSVKQIAKELNRFETSISNAARRMALPPKAWHSFGEVFDRPALERLLQVSGFDVPQLAQKLSMPGLVNSTRKPDWRLHFDHARKIAEWWKGSFYRLMCNASPHNCQSSIILTFFPNFKKRYSLLLDVLDRLAEDEDHRLAKKLAEAKKLGENPEKDPEWQRNELKEYLCEEAVRENTGKSAGDLFIQFLPWAPDLMPFFPEKLQALRVGRRQRKPLACEILAKSLGTTKGIIRRVLKPSVARPIRPISPQDMSRLILKAKLAEAEAAAKTAEPGVDQQQQAEAETAAVAAARAEINRLAEEVERLQPRDPGRPRGPNEETWRQMRLIAAFLRVGGWSLGRMSKFVCPDKGQSASANTRAVISSYRSEIDELRESMTMNEAEAIIQPYLHPAEKIA